VKKIFRYFSTNHLKRSGLIVFGALFCALSIAGETYAADQVFYANNDILFYDKSCSYSNATGNLTGNSIKEKIWNFLKQQGLTDEQAAGVMGNMQAESGFIPTRFQGDRAFNPWDSASGNGWGLPQWDGGRRYSAPDKGVLGKLKSQHPELVKYIDVQYDWAKDPAVQAKIPASDLDALLNFELTFLHNESMSRPVTAHGFGDAKNEWDTLKLQKTVEDATVFWHNNFEVSADSPQTVIASRGGDAKKILSEFGGKNTTSGAGSTTTAPVVFIDPGHGGAIPPYTDPQSGFLTAETHNMPESTDVLNVANRVKTALEKEGYKVVMARTTDDQQVKFRDRANAAKQAGASIGISIHTTPGNVNEAWPQRVGTYREYNGKKETFTNQPTAQKSEAYANNFATARTASEGHTVTTDPGNKTETGSFNRADIQTKGNTPLVELWSPDVPWVYNEIGQDQGTAISEGLKQKYADGIIKGVEQSVPLNTRDECGNTAFTGGNLAQTIFAYAWPDYHAADYTTKKPEYEAAVKKALSQGRYVGGGQYPGVDCGGFVTTLMVDSGFEPKYNSSGKGGNTTAQKAWLDANWELLPSNYDTGKLQPGDVAMSSGHTFVYAGDIPNFHSPTKVASASYSIWRAPMAGHEGLSMSGFRWYRKK
jgi:N-acetylmuramoyl-L-alanine amidase